MTEQEIKQEHEQDVVSGKEVDTGNTDYLAAIKELKENSVSKEEYNRIKEDNKRLLDSLVNGETVEQEAKELRPTIDELREKLFIRSSELTNLDFIKTALDLREELIAEGQPDPFLPQGKNIAPTSEDIAEANHAAEVFKECVDFADGDSALFTAELQRRTAEAFPAGLKKGKK